MKAHSRHIRIKHHDLVKHNYDIDQVEIMKVVNLNYEMKIRNYDILSRYILVMR